ncbi:sugar transport protein 5-like isoform X3 [Ananas comosus]|nr:sugar transport protein 5-like isoform X3 [Ananas comosus]
MAEAKQDDEYCMYDSQALTAFTSSLYVAGLAASLAAGRLTKAVGRQTIMLLGGALFFTGATVNASAANVEMLILGRILLGFGVGFTNQAAPVYLAEVSPARWRGAFTTGFQFFIGVGVVAANLTNYGAARLRSWGWRLSLGLAAAPACVFILGALLIPDTPSSLLHRGMPIDTARAALRRLRGSSADVDAELNDIARAAEDARRNEEGAFARMVLGRRYRPQLAMAVAIPLFQQLTGVTVVAFFAPVLFRTVGFGSDGALVGAVILGCVNLASILVSAFTVDRLGRRKLFIVGGAQMIICQVLQCYTTATGTLVFANTSFIYAREGGGGLDNGGENRRRWRGGNAERVRSGRAGADVRLLCRVRVVMGAAELDHPGGDLPRGGPVGGAGDQRGRQPRLHLRPDAALPRHALPVQVCHLCILRRLGRGHDRLRRRLPPRDQRGAPRVHGLGVGASLVLGSVHRR